MNTTRKKRDNLNKKMTKINIYFEIFCCCCCFRFQREREHCYDPYI